MSIHLLRVMTTRVQRQAMREERDGDRMAVCADIECVADVVQERICGQPRSSYPTIHPIVIMCAWSRTTSNGNRTDYYLVRTAIVSKNVVTFGSSSWFACDTEGTLYEWRAFGNLGHEYRVWWPLYSLLMCHLDTDTLVSEVYTPLDITAHNL